MEHCGYYTYLNFDGGDFFTAVLLPDGKGCFPTVVCRSPYVSQARDIEEDKLVESYLTTYLRWLERGYAVVFQHCRGHGKSSGAFVPYIHEREDGLALREWIRNQPFYNGELYLLGASYTASLHYATAPFEPDVKAAVFEVQDFDRYRLWYRNGQMRRGHANWHFGLYKSKRDLKKKFSKDSFSELPLMGLSERALGERAEDFEQMLAAESPASEFWSTRLGGVDARGATTHANIPILLTTGYNDFYVGGMFKMWQEMDIDTKQKSAMLVSPYNHGDGYDKDRGLCFHSGKRSEQFGSDYRIDWFDHVKEGRELPFRKGVITYYRVFEDCWESDFYADEVKELTIPLGSGVRSFVYDPLCPPAFEAEGFLRGDEVSRPDVVTVYTPPFEEAIFVKGRMKAKLTVSSSAPDTSFYVNVSVKKSSYEYLLRHDVTSLCYQLGDYVANTVVELDFGFDEYAFLLEKGDRLRFDIAATDSNVYVPHTNQKGAYYIQTHTQTAANKVYLDASCVMLPIE